MNINEIVESGANITIQTTPNDLLKFLEQVAEKQQKKDDDRHISRKQVAEMFDVDESTVWRWDKIGYTHPVKVGGKVRYRLSELQKLLKHE